MFIAICGVKCYYNRVMIAKKEMIRKLLEEGGIAEVIGRKDLEKKLISGKKIKIKFGADPTRPDLHLGHAVVFRKLREFQELGHKVLFLIGDATTKIGDPTGKDKTRPVMSEAEIKKNAETYIKQVSKILKLDKNLLEIRFNSEWYSKMSFYEFLNLMTMTTAARILERDMFQERMKSGRDIGLHELVYPVMQGYDSVELKNDVVLLGSDQKFNELFGRHYQEKFQQDPQTLVIMKLLVGLDGKEKMSKSLDNYVGVTDNADQMYGKIMSLPDDAMEEYFELATDIDKKGLDALRGDVKSGKISLRDTKMKLAGMIVELYHGAEKAKSAEDNFVRVFQKRESPDKVSSVKINVAKIKLTDFMVRSGSAKSISDARRKIEQGGVSINGKVITDFRYSANKSDNGKIIKVGKKDFRKIIFG